MCVCVFFHSAQAMLLFPAFLYTIYFFYYSFQHFSLTLVTLLTNSSGCSFFLCLLWTPNAPLFRCAWASVIFLFLLFFYLGLHQERRAPRINASKQCRPWLPLSLGVYLGRADSISALHRPHRAMLRFTTRENIQRKAFTQAFYFIFSYNLQLKNTEKFYWASFEFILEAVNMNDLLSDRTILCFKLVSDCLVLFLPSHFYEAGGCRCTLCQFIQMIIIPPSNHKDPDSIITLPQGIRWWLLLQKTLLFCPTFPTLLPYIYLNICNILYLPTDLKQTAGRTERPVFGFVWGSGSFIWGSGSSEGSVCVCVSLPVFLCVCGYVCVCVLGGIRPALVDSGALNYSPSVTFNYRGGLRMHTARLCVCRSPPAVSCWRDELQVSTCDLAGWALHFITLGDNPLALVLVNVTITSRVRNPLWHQLPFFTPKLIWHHRIFILISLSFTCYFSFSLISAGRFPTCTLQPLL